MKYDFVHKFTIFAAQERRRSDMIMAFKIISGRVRFVKSKLFNL